MDTKLLVRRAKPNDIDVAVQVVTEVAQWLASRDIPWLLDFPGPFPEQIAAGEVYLAYLNDWQTLTGTISLGRKPDPEFWADYPGRARYIHRLAVRRRYAGRGIGDALLDLASHLTAMEGVPWLRLDCNKDNGALQNYYIRHGFEHLDTINLPHRISGALFQEPSRILSRVVELPDKRFETYL